MLSFHAMVRRTDCIMPPFWKGVRRDVPSGMAGRPQVRVGADQAEEAAEGGGNE